jgi:predicted RecA/RadA family phage recombinase
MKNFVQRGDVVTAIAPAGGVLSGQGCLVGSLFGVASFDAAESKEVELSVAGVFDIAKVSTQEWTAGAPIYWKADDKVATNVAAGNTLIGVATLGAANPSAIGRVRLNGVFGVATTADIAALDARLDIVEAS